MGRFHTESVQSHASNYLAKSEVLTPSINAVFQNLWVTSLLGIIYGKLIYELT